MTVYTNTFSGADGNYSYSGTFSLSIGIDGEGDITGTGTITYSSTPLYLGVPPEPAQTTSGEEFGSIDTLPPGFQIVWTDDQLAGFEGDFSNSQSQIIGTISISDPDDSFGATIPVTLYGQPALPPVISLSSGSLRINADAGTATYTLTRGPVPLGDLGSSVEVSTEEGTAVAGKDYEAISDMIVSFAAGQTTATVTVSISPDSTDAAAGINPDFEVVLSNPVNASIGFGTADTTIVENNLPPTNFHGPSSDTSDVLYRNNTSGDTGFYNIVNGANSGWVDVGASSAAYSVVGTGDFTGSGTDDVLYRNSATGDTGFYEIVNGVDTGWHDVGASSTAYSVVGVGDFFGSGTDDILYRNNTTGDTGFYKIVNGANTGWHDVGASSTAYSVVGVGDFFGNGTDDILYRNNTTGDTGFYEIVNGVNTGWHDIGASSTAYSVVGVGDFFGNGTDDILYRNNTTGDTGFYAISNGVNIGWHDIGASSTAYSVVGIGHYLGNGTSDVLFRNITGDTGFYAISNGVNAGWHDIGASSTAYQVMG